MIKKMNTGRPSNIPRTEFGRRLREAREHAGFSQAEFGARLGVNQRTIAYWERRPTAFRPEQLAAIAKVLDVSIEQLVYDKPPKTKPGPMGKVKASFLRVMNLSKREQAKIVDVVDAMIEKAAKKKGLPPNE